MSTELAHHHALVTGAGSGIGLAIATALHGAGAKVTLAGRRLEPLVALADRLGGDRLHVAAGFDVTDRAAIEEGLVAARTSLGPVSLLVNNAGQAPSSAFAKTTRAIWDHVIATDLTSLLDVTQACLDDLKAAGSRGRIITIASTAGLKGYAYVSAYCAAKHGAIGLTRALAVELAATGMTVNAVCPGYTDTPIVSQSVAAIAAKTGRAPADILKEFTKANPQGRLIDPDEVAQTVLWLASDAARSVTGQAIAIAGGEVM